MDRIDMKIIPIAAIFLSLITIIFLIPSLTISSLKEAFSYSEIGRLFIPKRIEERVPISINKNQKELFSSNHKKINLKKNYSPYYLFRKQNRKIFNTISKNELDTF